LLPRYSDHFSGEEGTHEPIEGHVFFYGKFGCRVTNTAYFGFHSGGEVAIL
jgi:hypothetical protein